MPRIIKIGVCFTELFKKIKVASFYDPRCLAQSNEKRPHSYDRKRERKSQKILYITAVYY